MAKDKDNPFLLMGFGHRVYKNYDPRATIIKAACDKLLAKRHINDPIFDVAKQLEEVALTRCCSRWAACRAGSPIGWKCTATPTPKSAARGRSIQGQTSAHSCRSTSAVSALDVILSP
jgi:hypothetical protein